MKHSINEEPPLREEVTLVSKYGICFIGRYVGESQFKVVTRYELLDDGTFNQLVTTMHQNYFDYWISHE